MAVYLKQYNTKQIAIDATDVIAPNVTYCNENNQILIGGGNLPTNTPMDIVADGPDKLKYNQKTEPEMVDLGLPSHTLWAKCNIGATTETGYGKYFAWGETTGYEDFTAKQFTWGDYAMTSATVSNLTRNAPLDKGGYFAYSNDTETYYFDEAAVGNETWAFEKQGEDNFVFVAGKIFENAGTYYFNKILTMATLDAPHDAATVTYGEGYTMPSQEDFKELKNNTNHSWTSNYKGSGIAGYTFTANDNTLFIPAAGYARNGSISNIGSAGHTWSSSLHSDASSYFFDFTKDTIGDNYNNRYLGMTVRAVKRNN